MGLLKSGCWPSKKTQRSSTKPSLSSTLLAFLNLKKCGRNCVILKHLQSVTLFCCITTSRQIISLLIAMIELLVLLTGELFTVAIQYEISSAGIIGTTMHAQ